MADDDNASKLTPVSDADEDSAAKPDEPTVSRVPQKVARASSPLTSVALVIALIAAGLAVWALMRSPEESAATGGTSSGDAGSGDAAASTSPEDAKQRVCDAGQVVSVAVQLQTNANLGSEPAAVEAVAANARLAMLAGGDYLLSQIDASTPADLADAARSFATTLRVVGINQLAGVTTTDPAQEARLRESEGYRNTLAKLCMQ